MSESHKQPFCLNRAWTTEVNMIDQGSFQPSSREGEATVHSEAYAKSWEDSNHSQHRLEKWAEEELSPPTFQPSSTVKDAAD